MLSVIRIIAALIIFLSVSSCAIVVSPGTITSTSSSPTNQLDPLEIALSKFPVLRAQYNNSLYVTVINYKAKRIAEIELIEDSVSLSSFPYEDSLRFRIQIRDFDKTENVSSIISLPLRLVENLNFEKISAGNYRIRSSQDNNRSCLLRNVQLQADQSDNFYTHSGQLISASGSEVRFWAQADVPATKIIYGAVIIACNSIDGVKTVVDLCKIKVEEAMKRVDCKTPTVYLKYECKPLAEIFDRAVFENFYKDCKVFYIKCPNKATK